MKACNAQDACNIKPQQAVTPDVIAYANGAEDAAETEDDHSFEMEDGLERGA